MAEGRPEPKIRVEVIILKARILKYQPIGFWLQLVKYQIIKEIPSSYRETYELMTQVR